MFLFLFQTYYKRKLNAVQVLFLFYIIGYYVHCAFSSLNELVLNMNPQFDFSIQSGDNIFLQCTVTNPKYLYYITNGRLHLMLNGSLITGLVKNYFLKISNKYLTHYQFPKVSTNSQSSVHFSVGERYTFFSTIWRKLSATGDDSGRYTCSHSGYDHPISVSVYITVNC